MLEDEMSKNRFVYFYLYYIQIILLEFSWYLKYEFVYLEYFMIGIKSLIIFLIYVIME